MRFERKHPGPGLPAAALCLMLLGIAPAAATAQDGEQIYFDSIDPVRLATARYNDMVPAAPAAVSRQAAPSAGACGSPNCPCGADCRCRGECKCRYPGECRGAGGACGSPNCPCGPNCRCRGECNCRYPGECWGAGGCAAENAFVEIGCCEPCEEEEIGCLMKCLNERCGEDHWLAENGINIGGWMQWGYHSDSNGLFNKHPHRINLHQWWLYAEKVADGSNGFDWGFRADAMYGVDAQDTQAFGNPPGSWDFMNGFDHGIYGWAIPQLYVEGAWGDWTVKAGHFYTIVGYEVVTAPDNFFYSHAYTMFNSEPFTHTGVLASYQVSDTVTAHGGWTAGWDTGFDQFDDGSNFLGGASVALTDDVTATYITTFGDFGWRGEGYSHSIVIDASFAEDWNYVFQSDLVDTNLPGDHQYGINQYLFYTVNEKVKLGGRMEWWKNNGNSQYAATFGVNVRPVDYFVVRPEIRHAWNPGGGNIIGNNDFTTFGVDAILIY